MYIFNVNMNYLNIHIYNNLRFQLLFPQSAGRLGRHVKLCKGGAKMHNFSDNFAHRCPSGSLAWEHGVARGVPIVINYDCFFYMKPRPHPNCVQRWYGRKKSAPIARRALLTLQQLQITRTCSSSSGRRCGPSCRRNAGRNRPGDRTRCAASVVALCPSGS
jgi:hypothetical protein